jgi:putative ABC transport system permease protein
MKYEELIGQSWLMVLRHKKRYRTVIIAICIGTIGFIMIRTLSQAVENKISGKLDFIGGVTLVEAYWDDRRAPYHPGEYLWRDVRELSKIPHVVTATPVRQTQRILKVNHERTEVETIQITCVDENYWQTIATPLDSGRLLDRNDVSKRAQVCVLGHDVAAELFGEERALGSVVELYGYRYKVVGVLGLPTKESITRSVFIPISLATQHMGHLRRLVTLRLRTDSISNVRSVLTQAEERLKALHPQFADGIRMMWYSARFKRVQFIMFLVKIFCYSALVAVFVVGKMGLTNVMLEVVKDRTREIGLRKALGATDSIIRAQFVLESVFVSLFAGTIGIVGGIASVLVLKDVLDVSLPYDVLSTSVMVDLTITIIVGVAAGMHPSSQASRLDIVTALRFE